jgi:DNA-binding transcriptional LysR family regulator
MTPPGHPLLQRQPIQLSDTSAWPLILAGPESQTRRRVEQTLKDQGVSYDIVLEMDNTELIKRYVEIGMGVAIGSDFTLHPEDHYKLGVVRLDHIFSSSVIGICTLKGKFMGRAVRNFVDTVIKDLKGIHPEIEGWDDQNRGREDLAAATPPGQ